MALLRKKTPPPVEEPDRPLVVKPGGKGRATPTRKEAQAARRGRPAARSGDPKEARKAAREERRQKTQSYRAAMLSGDIDKLPPRERVPERVLARDTVDARRNFGPVFLCLLLLNFVSSLLRSPVLEFFFFYLLFLALVVFVIDAFLLTRKVTAVVAERYPNSRVPVKMYAVQRSILPGRFRMPRPRHPVAGWLPAALRNRGR
jgi:hypothetical protein